MCWRLQYSSAPRRRQALAVLSSYLMVRRATVITIVAIIGLIASAYAVYVGGQLDEMPGYQAACDLVLMHKGVQEQMQPYPVPLGTG